MVAAAMLAECDILFSAQEMSLQLSERSISELVIYVENP